MAVVPIIDTLKQVLDETPGVRLAVLFGSAAKGTARRHSDLDVGVWLDAGAVNGEPLSTLAVALERAAKQPVDLVPLDTAPPLLRFEIARSGVVLADRDGWQWADFRAHAMIDWWDWAPTARMMHERRIQRLREATRGPS